MWYNFSIPALIYEGKIAVSNWYPNLAIENSSIINR